MPTILNFNRLIGENTFEGVIDGHIEAKNVDLYEGCETLDYGLIIFPNVGDKNNFGDKGNEQVNIGDTIVSIYCESITSDTSKPTSLASCLVPIRIIRK